VQLTQRDWCLLLSWCLVVGIGEEKHNKFLAEVQQWKDDNTPKIVKHDQDLDIVFEEEIRHRIERQVDFKDDQRPKWIIKNTHALLIWSELKESQNPKGENIPSLSNIVLESTTSIENISSFG
jgi:hypothetical protein